MASEPSNPHPDPALSAPPTPPALPVPVVPLQAGPGGAGGPGGAPTLAYLPDRRRRLHIATVLVAVVSAAKSLSWAIALALLLRFSGRSGGMFEVVIAGVGSLQVVAAAFRYATTRFAIESVSATGGGAGSGGGGGGSGGVSLVIESGLIFKNRRAVPVARIQNINISRDLGHRMFGVAEVKIETAAGASAEATLSALSLAEAEELKQDLLVSQRLVRGGASAVGVNAAVAANSGVGESASAAPVVPPTEVVYSAGAWDLFLAGATRTRVGAVVGSVFGGFYFLEDAMGSIITRFLPADPTHLVTRMLGMVFSDDSADSIAAVAGAVMIALLAVLAGWLLSIGTSLVRYWGFSLSRAADGKLTRKFGLLTMHDLAFPRERLQKLTIEATVIQRKLGLCKIEARTAGSYMEKEAAGTAMLCPIARRENLLSLVDEVVDGYRPHEANWQRVSRVAIRRWTVRNTVVLSTLLIPGALWWSWWVMLGAVALVPLAWWLARAEYKVTQYAFEGDLILFRDGVLTRKTRVIPRKRVQVSTVRASPIQGWLGLASLNISTAADPMLADASIPNLSREVAEALQDGLVRGRPPGKSTEMPQPR